MKHMKIVGLVAVAAMALMAFASSASATELYSGATTLKSGTEIKASLTGTASLTTTEGTVLDTCSGGEVNGKTSNNGSTTETVKGSITALTWTNCTEPTSTITKGTLEVHYTSGNNGTLTAGTTPSEVTVNTTIFGSCVFTIEAGKTIGTVTGSTSGNATFDINAVATRKSGLCPSSSNWTGTYTVTSPSPFRVATS